MFEQVMTYSSQLILLVGVLALVISVITEVTKNIPLLKRIPTDVQVLVLSLVLCVVLLFAYASYANIAIVWYFVIAAIILAFFVAFVAMYGWEKLSTLWKRYKYAGEDEETEGGTDEITTE